jgi:hypothetical protein
MSSVAASAKATARRLLGPPLRAAGRDPRRDAVRLATRSVRALPDFLVIGAQKAGTTALFVYLCAHPEVLAPVEKEVHFFDQHWANGVPWYRAHFPTTLELAARRRGGRTAITGEATPYYLFHPRAPERAAATVPDARLIVMLRNPVDRAYSQYHHRRRLGLEDLSFEDAVAAEPERLAADTERLAIDPDHDAVHHREHSYLSRGRYAPQLGAWLERYPRDRLHVIRTEDFDRDPAAVYAETAAFLGLSAWLPDRFERFINEGSYEPMDPATRARLIEGFADDNRATEAVVGRPMDWDR